MLHPLPETRFGYGLGSGGVTACMVNALSAFFFVKGLAEGLRFRGQARCRVSAVREVTDGSIRLRRARSPREIVPSVAFVQG